MNKNHDSQEILQELVNNWDVKLFKTLGEPVRLQIMLHLIRNGRSDIGTISSHLPQDRSVISRHLNMMFENGVLNCEKVNRFRFYSINSPLLIERLETIVSLIKKCTSVLCVDDRSE